MATAGRRLSCSSCVAFESKAGGHCLNDRGLVHGATFLLLGDSLRGSRGSLGGLPPRRRPQRLSPNTYKGSTALYLSFSLPQQLARGAGLNCTHSAGPERGRNHLPARRLPVQSSITSRHALALRPAHDKIRIPRAGSGCVLRVAGNLVACGAGREPALKKGPRRGAIVGLSCFRRLCRARPLKACAQ